MSRTSDHVSFESFVLARDLLDPSPSKREVPQSTRAGERPKDSPPGQVAPPDVEVIVDDALGELATVLLLHVGNVVLVLCFMCELGQD